MTASVPRRGTNDFSLTSAAGPYMTYSIRPLFRHTPSSPLLAPEHAQKLSPEMNVALVGGLEVFGQPVARGPPRALPPSRLAAAEWHKVCVFTLMRVLGERYRLADSDAHTLRERASEGCRPQLPCWPVRAGALACCCPLLHTL